MLGILFKSEAQYVGDHGDIWDSFIFVIALNSSRPFVDISELITNSIFIWKYIEISSELLESFWESELSWNIKNSVQ